jgi:hypothetical protein
METMPQAPSKAALWTGRILSAVPVLMLLLSAVMKFLKPPQVVDGFNRMGLPFSLVTGLGVLELLCTVTYLIPATSVLGAILLTGYMGGAVLASLRIGDPSYFGAIAVGIMLWGGLYLRTPRLRTLIPLRR